MSNGTTINADCYCETFKDLPRAIQNERRGMLTKGVRFHQDNAHHHTARATTDLINQYGWDTVKHLPYSPDLAPSDYYLFPELKLHLGGTSFRTDVELKDVVRYLHAAAGEFYDTGIKKMVYRMLKCIDRNGDYVEK